MATRARIEQLLEELDRYKSERGNYPATQEEFVGAVRRMPSHVSLADGWGRVLRCVPGDPANVLSLGADGRQGGINFDADVDRNHLQLQHPAWTDTIVWRLFAWTVMGNIVCLPAVAFFQWRRMRRNT